MRVASESGKGGGCMGNECVWVCVDSILCICGVGRIGHGHQQGVNDGVDGGGKD